MTETLGVGGGVGGGGESRRFLILWESRAVGVKALTRSASLNGEMNVLALIISSEIGSRPVSRSSFVFWDTGASCKGDSSKVSSVALRSS